jgi:hypothetical protein
MFLHAFLICMVQCAFRAYGRVGIIGGQMQDSCSLRGLAEILRKGAASGWKEGLEIE